MSLFWKVPVSLLEIRQDINTCRHFIALVSLFQGRVAGRNLPLTGPCLCWRLSCVF